MRIQSVILEYPVLYRCYSVSTGGSVWTKVYDGGLEDASSAKHERHHARRSDGQLH